MTPLVWANFPLAALFLLAWIGIPMWMTFKRPEQPPDRSEAEAYYQAKAALAQGESVITVPAAGMTVTRQHMTATRQVVPGRLHAGAGLARRSHQVPARRHTRASA
jgi:hypothetical protein